MAYLDQGAVKYTAVELLQKQSSVLFFEVEENAEERKEIVELGPSFNRLTRDFRE